MLIQSLTITPFAQNARILFDQESGEAAIVDPGGAGLDAAEIVQRVKKLNPKRTSIWLTHAHLDHCGGVAEVKRQFRDASLLGHRDDRDFRGTVEEIARMYGIPDGSFENCPEPDRYINDGDRLTLGQVEFQALFTPGHAPGHLCFYCPQEKFLVCGDTVFAGSIGRTDFPGCSHEQLLDSIRSKILSLPGETRLLPGHGPDTTVEREKRSNPFLVG